MIKTLEDLVVRRQPNIRINANGSIDYIKCEICIEGSGYHKEWWVKATYECISDYQKMENKMNERVWMEATLKDCSLYGYCYLENTHKYLLVINFKGDGALHIEIHDR